MTQTIVNLSAEMNQRKTYKSVQSDHTVTTSSLVGFNRRNDKCSFLHDGQAVTPSVGSILLVTRIKTKTVHT